MAGNRNAAQQQILKDIEQIAPGGANRKIYEDLFSQMTDEQFEEMMVSFEAGTSRPAVIAPNLPKDPKTRLSVVRNLKIAEEWGVKLFERIWLTRDDGTSKYLSPIPYMVVELPLRRQAQILIKKISIPEHNNTTDDLTGQAAGASKGSKISYPEMQILNSLDLTECLTEFMKVRGGDTKAFDESNTSISRTGSFSLREVEKLGSTVKAKQTLSTFFTSMHLQNII